MLQLQTCVVKSNAAAYSTDIDRMTPVQGLVLETLQSVPPNIPELVPELVGSIDNFVTVYEVEYTDEHVHALYHWEGECSQFKKELRE